MNLHGYKDVCTLITRQPNKAFCTFFFGIYMMIKKKKELMKFGEEHNFTVFAL